MKLKCELSRRKEFLELQGSLVECVSLCCRLIMLVYSRCCRTDPRMGEAFKAMILHGMTDPASPIWTQVAPGNVTDIMLVSPPRGDRS